jgi:RecT family
MADQQVQTIEHDEQSAEEFAKEQVEAALKRRDLLGADALDKIRKRQDLTAGAQANAPSLIHGGNFSPTQLRDAMDFATMMAAADIAIPIHLRANPGACLAITMQSLAWGFEPFFVANKSYAVKQRKSGDVRIAYESQLIHAVIERRAPLERRLRPIWIAEGGELMCHIHGFVIGEKDPFIWEGLKLKDVKIKNSPEWANNPRKQLFYHSSRDWARIYFPDVLGGVYTRDEMEGVELGPNARLQGGGNILTRLAHAQSGGDGYDPDHIARELDDSRAEKQEQRAAVVLASGTRTSKPRKPGKQPSQKPADREPQLQLNSEPATAAEYTVWAERWIGNIDNADMADNAEARWDGERDDRTRLKVSVKDRTRLETLLKQQCAKARGQADA